MQALTKYEERTGPWILTHSGRRFYPFQARVDDIYLEDIAHCLASLPFYNGNCTRHYSLLEHSLHVAGLVPKPQKASALLQHAACAYLSPIHPELKNHPVFASYREAEDSLQLLIDLRFALPSGPLPNVHLATKAMAYWEHKQLFEEQQPEWDRWKRYADYFPAVTLPRYAQHPEALIETFAKELLDLVGHEVLSGTHLELQPAEYAQ